MPSGPAQFAPAAAAPLRERFKMQFKMIFCKVMWIKRTSEKNDVNLRHNEFQGHTGGTRLLRCSEPRLDTATGGHQQVALGAGLGGRSNMSDAVVAACNVRLKLNAMRLGSHTWAKRQCLSNLWQSQVSEEGAGNESAERGTRPWLLCQQLPSGCTTRHHFLDLSS